MPNRCPECDGRGIQGPHFPSIGERAEDFICKRCDGNGYAGTPPDVIAAQVREMTASGIAIECQQLVKFGYGYAGCGYDVAQAILAELGWSYDISIDAWANREKNPATAG